MITDKSIRGSYPIDPNEEDFDGFACSSYDCTGLIPSSPVDNDEAQAYEELYPYLPPDATDGYVAGLEYME